MQELIKAWLNGKRDYNQGVALYERFGRYTMVAIMLRQGKESSELHREKLLACLTEMASDAPPPPKDFKALPKKNTTQQAPEPPDEYLKELDAKWKPLYTEMATLHSRLLAVDTDEARLGLAKRIVAIHEQLVTYWQQRDYYIIHKTPMPKPARKVIKADITQTDLRKLLNARSARSQYKRIHLPLWEARLASNPSEYNRKKVEKHRAKIAQYDKIIAQYEQEVTGHN